MANIKKIPDLNKGERLHRKGEHKPKPDAPLTPGAKAAAASSDPRIDIRLYKRRLVGTFYAVVQLYSRVQPNYLVEAPLEVSGKSLSDLDFECGVLCGAMAERLNEVYSDNLDSEQCARLGARQLSSVFQAYEHKSDTIPERKVQE